MKNIKVEIFDISYEGAGVAKLDGQVVFVPKTLLNEEVEIEITKKYKNFLNSKLTSVLKKNPERIEALCPYFEICGGCDFQHCSQKLENEIKIQIAKNELKKVGFIGQVEFVESSNRFFYRNKIKLEVFDNKLCFHKSKSNEIFPVEKCFIACEEINGVLDKVVKFLQANNFKFLKSVYIKEVDKKLFICLLFSQNVENSMKNIKNLDILSDFSLFFAYGEILESNKTKIFCIQGKEKLKKNHGTFDIEVDVSSFNQVNDDIAQKLYEFVVSKAEGKRVVNAYSGQGLLTLLMAQKAKFVYGIEYQKSAHQSAEKLKQNLVDYKIENLCGKVEDVLSGVLLKDRIDMIVLDPSREGCQESVLNEIAKSKIEEVIYISCNLATLTRDLKYLLQDYELQNVQIFDMFPCTANLETVAVLKRKV